ncbi:MAG TPA: cation:proton antiporter [Candidatus Baltobacteraceae bacterium]|nr:cation:proton antiporter [Candidatus Baltobacteraceae bacterium]
MGNGTSVFLADLTIALVAASILGSLARALRITPILGYVVAGIAIGPFTPGYRTADASLSGLGELGLILLLFSLGLGFSVRELRHVGIIPSIGNVVLMAAFGAVTWALATLVHFPHPITLALAFTLSSTAIGVALLQTFGLLDKRPGQAAVALLVMQDLLAVLILVATTTPPEQLTPLGSLVPLVKAAIFVIVALVLGATVLHRIVIGFLRRAPSEAMIAFCTAVALVAAWLGHLAGLSFEFGAFVAGAVTSEAAGSRIVQSIVAPFRELFVMLFFVSIGTLVDVGALAASWQAVVIIGTGLVLVRFGGWYALSRFVHQRTGTAIALGIALIPLGEFNVVLANDSFLAHRLNSNEYGSAIGATLLSILLAALAARIVAPRRTAMDGAARAPSETHANVPPAIVILGYGRAGRTVGALCLRAGIAFSVVELDVDALRLAQQEGVDAHYGDGADPSAIARVLTPQTRIVLSTIPDSAINAAIARRLATHGVRVVSRAERLRDVPMVRKAGAKDVLVPEAEGAFGFAQAVLAELGLTEDHIDALIREQRAALAY